MDYILEAEVLESKIRLLFAARSGVVFSLQHRSGWGVAEQGWTTQFPGLLSSGWFQDESGGTRDRMLRT